VADYDASAIDTINRGRYFEFVDRDSGEPRVGYYDPWTERLTVLSSDEQIIHSHYRCPERYIVRLRGSTYT